MKETRKQLPHRFWVETALGGLSAALFALTILMPDWIERLFGVAPDAGNGATEWALAFSLAAFAIVMLVFAGRSWRKHIRLLQSA